MPSRPVFNLAAKVAKSTDATIGPTRLDKAEAGPTIPEPTIPELYIGVTVNS